MSTMPGEVRGPAASRPLELGRHAVSGPTPALEPDAAARLGVPSGGGRGGGARAHSGVGLGAHVRGALLSRVITCHGVLGWGASLAPKRNKAMS